MREGDSEKTEKQLQRERDVEECAGKIRSRAPRIRAAAAERLGQLQAGVELLLEALRDPNSYVREAAARALGSAATPGDSEVIDALMVALDDPNDHVCSASIRALGRLRVTAAVRELTPFLRASNPKIVQATLGALARILGQQGAPLIEPSLDSPDPFTQAAAAQALALVDHRPAGPRILALLRQALDSDPGSRNVTTLLESLASLQVAEAIPLLTHVASNHVGLRSIAVEALVRLGAAEVAPLLAGLLADPSASLRRNLLELIHRTSYRPAAPLVRALLDDPALPTRRAALRLAVHLGDTGALPRIRAICRQDPSPHLRPVAVQALHALAGRDAIADLQALTADPNALVRAAVHEALRQLAVAATTPPPPLPSPLPADIEPDRDQLASLLSRWRAALPSQASALPVERLHAIDQALDLLLGELK